MRPELATVDLVIIGLYVVFAIGVGAMFTRKASESAEGFFVGDRKLPWWIAGTSIVATTFAADTPLAVTGLVAAGGISANWIWWSWAIAHVVATFYFARLWRRSGVITDAEIIELRYSGKAAAFLRGFKALYFGIFINCLTMAWVIAAMVKISQAFFAVDSTTVIAACILVSVTYTTLGGFRGVVITDIVQFSLGMGGAIAVAILVVDSMGGVGVASTADVAGTGLVGQLEETLGSEGKNSFENVMAFIPPMDHPMIPAVYFAVLLLAGWWRLAEGSGYLVQRLAASRDEGHAQAASLWFAVAHNALRPWPWILVGLASLVVYPMIPGDAPAKLEATVGDATWSVSPAQLDIVKGGVLTFEGAPDGCEARIAGKPLGVIEDHQIKVGAQEESFISTMEVVCDGERKALFDGLRVELTDREMGYPLLLGKTLPAGLLGLVIASLLAAFMSTIDTHTNWGASYLVQDVYRRFLKPDASEEHYVWASRACIVLIAIVAGGFAMIITNIASVWVFIITVGAGLGSVTAARWFWSRVTPFAELAALGVTTVVALSLQLFFSAKLFGGENPLFTGHDIPAWQRILIVAGFSLATWVPVALFGPQNDEATLRKFAEKVHPPGSSFARFGGEGSSLLKPLGFVAAGIVIVYGTLWGLGEIIFGRAAVGGAICLAAVAALVFVARGRRTPD
jgi:Na+/proline symporter